MFRFTIRDLVLLTTIVSIASAWWVDRNRLMAANQTLRERNVALQDENKREVARYEQAWQALHDPFYKPNPFDGLWRSNRPQP